MNILKLGEEIMKINSRFPKDILNEIKYRGGNLSNVEIFYINRGSSNDIASMNGKRIWGIERGFLKLYNIPYEIYIPYHRILKIEYNNEIIFDKSNYGKKISITTNHR